MRRPLFARPLFARPLFARPLPGLALPALATLALALTASESGAWTGGDELRPAGAVTGDWLGFAVALDGPVALVSAHRSSRLVHVFERDARGEWSRSAVLRPSVSRGSLFGYSVALAGDRAVVGYSSGSAVHVFERRSDGTWDEAAELTPPEGASRALFGRGLALDADTVLVSAAGGGGSDAPRGSVHAFERAGDGTWWWTGAFSPEDGFDDDRFGASLALSGDTALVGEAHVGRAVPFTRTVFVFERDASGAWSETQRLTVSAEDRRPRFGETLALDGDLALAGDRSASVEDTPLAGVVHELRRGRGGWETVAVHAANPPRARGGFGTRVALRDGTVAVVSSSEGYEQLAAGGAVDVFTCEEPGDWLPAGTVRSPRPEPGDGFGRALATDGEAVLVGAPLAVAPPATERDPTLGGNDSLGTAWLFAPGRRGVSPRPVRGRGELRPRPGTRRPVERRR